MKKIVLLVSIVLLSLIIFYSIEKKEEVKDFSNEGNVELAIYLEEEQTSTIPSRDSGYYFDRKKTTCTNEAYINWDSVTWSPVVMNAENYPVRCELHFTTTYTEGILNGTDPILKDELIPVKIDENGTVKKADLTSEWYSYANKEWANAVILEDQYDSLNTQGNVYGATKEDGYVSFDGVDDFIDLGLENYDFKNSFTISIFISLLSDVSQEFLANVEKAGISMYFSDSEFKVQFYNEQTNQYEILSWITLDWNQFHILSATYDGFTFKMYADGNLVAQKEIQGNVKPSSMPFLLGANPQPDGSKLHYSNSNIKQLIIYNRALNEEEIKESASNEIKVVDDTGLLRYVDFTNKSYGDNEIIPEEKIESYFVWIPKYRYQLWDLGLYDSLTSIDTSKVHEIPIIFGDYNTSDSVKGECTTPMTSGETGNCEVGDYMTQPAFLSIPSTGFWVGKFETGYEGATSTSEAEINERNADKIIVKPNTYSWRSIQVANAFYSSYDYKRNLDSHMMKNTEWGAVAYLQHSQYGSATNLRTNNNSLFITGYASTTDPSCFYTGVNEACCVSEEVLPSQVGENTSPYNTDTGYLASTTGNIMGIYDMSGGAWEYVMGAMLNTNGELIAGNNFGDTSGFNGFLIFSSEPESAGENFPNQKYYDIYNYTYEDTRFTNCILGDATGEMGPFQVITYADNINTLSSWYSSKSWTISYWAASSWYIRGWNNFDALNVGLGTSIFNVDNSSGREITSGSFRLILTPT